MQMRAWEKAQAKAAAAGTKRVTDLVYFDGVHHELETKTAVDALNYLNANVDKFSEGDYKSLRAKIGGALGDDGQTIESVRSDINVIQLAMQRAGVGDEHRGEILALYDSAQAEYQEMNGGQKPPADWRENMVDSIAAKIKVTRPGLLNDSGMKPIHQFDQFSKEIPAEHTKAVLMGFGNANEGSQNIPEADLELAYQKAMAALTAGGISKPSNLAITQMIQWQQGAAE